MLGIAEEPLEGFDVAEGIVFKGVRVKGIYGRKMFDTWQTMKQLLSSDRFGLARDLKKILAEKEYTFDKYREAFENLVTGKELKLVFVP